jgi:putative hydrolase of the HAD superfamily
MIKGIIFDFDNTLYDYEVTNSFALNILFMEISNDYKIDIEIIKNKYNIINKNIKLSNNYNNKFNKSIYIKQLIETLQIKIEFIGKYVKIYHDAFFNKFKIYDGVIELFQFLKKNHIQIAILSNNIFLQQYEKLQTSGIIEYIDILQTSDECGEEKPNYKIFYMIQNKMNIPFYQISYIGDNYQDDIEPAIHFQMFPIWLNSEENTEINIHKVMHFKKIPEVNLFMIQYLTSVNELLFLSKYFGQSILNVQGPGGNISVKLDNILFIKSSGHILGNMTFDNGYCLVNNNLCIDNVVKSIDNSPFVDIDKIKMFGNTKPSMETYFHSFMKKYTIHLHFILSNICMCSNNTSINNFKYNYKIIDYFLPGINLASEIYKLYDNECDIYFLKNHGLIITANTISEILTYYDYIYYYFNAKMNNKYSDEYLTFKISNIFYNNNKSKIIKIINIPVSIITNIIVCFPDLAIFIQNIYEITDIINISDMSMTKILQADIIIYNNIVFGIADTLTKVYSLIEIIESYNILCSENSTNLCSINDVAFLINMEQEKYRKQLK